MKYKINLIWDDEENVGIATSRDVPGLVLETESLSSLIERLQLAIPELLALNSDKLQQRGDLGCECGQKKLMKRLKEAVNCVRISIG